MEFMKQLKSTSTSELTATIHEKVQEIQKITDRSKNLKGTYVKTLNEATIKIQFATKELSARAQLAQPECAEKEMAVLRREIAVLLEENRYLKGEADNLRKKVRESEAVPVPTPAAPLAKREKTPSPPPTANIQESRDNRNHRRTRESNRDPRPYLEDNADADPLSPPHLYGGGEWDVQAPL